ncbi:hydroxymethylpyrimidine/phosphomethylpyrimidine kinase [Herminiimonas sp. CN]|uniref:bifunctional hydroxymethylpyrimidine kinase/phosphomethylpyrimidine kinase n=1 Tax=Herminiimonas sp. CN TaxID=1349818 RepID=UPI0004732378|nr:hydroxymethylpyrimidine/phosphomethylpyrimidine kinase [Herminiimonas sp. CN]
MQNQTSPLILTFGVSDPVGAIGVQADLASFAAMGCHGASVITSILIGDTARIEDIQHIETDWIMDQARMVLEDMPIAAFKVGALGSVENISMIAEIVSDYPDIPLILDPFISALPDQGMAEEDMLLAMRELLLPQTTLFLASATELNLLAETWREPGSADLLAEDAREIAEFGCRYLFLTGAPCALGNIANTLYSASGVVRHDVWQRLPGAFSGAGSTLSAAIAAMLASGLEVPEAALEAQEFTMAALSHAQRIGMGKLLPDRYFWARESGLQPP